MDIKIKNIKYCTQCPYGYYLDDFFEDEDEPNCRVITEELTNVECDNIKDGKRIKLLKEGLNDDQK